MQSSNPYLKKIVKEESAGNYLSSNTVSMTNVMIKAFIFLAMLGVAALCAYILATQGIDVNNVEASTINPQLIVLLIISGAVAGITGFIGIFFPKAAAVFGTLYSLSMGFLLGFLVALVDLVYPGELIGFSALAITLTIFASVFLMFTIGKFRASNRFIKIVFVFGISLLLFTLVQFIYQAISGRSLFNSADGSGFIILIILGLYAAYGIFVLILDFEFTKRAIDAGADKKIGWFLAFSMIISLVMIFVYVLKIIMYISSRK